MQPIPTRRNTKTRRSFI